MRRMIYPDNLLLRRLVLVDDYYGIMKRQKLLEFYKKTFGISCNFIECPYLFLEFIGCTKKKLNIKYSSSLQIDPQLSLGSITDSQVEELDKNLVEELKGIHDCVQKQIIDQKKIFEDRLAATLERSYEDKFSQKIIKKLFGKYIWLYENKYNLFLEVLTKALTWDVFVTLESNSLKILRERQLGYWYQNYNSEYPFGKIVDDLSSYYAHKFPEKNFLLKAREDMVDSKMMTLPITGNMQDGIIRRVDVITFDTNVTAERAKLSLGSIKNIEKTLNLSLPKKFGSIFCLSETTDENDPFHIEIIQNQYLIKL